MSDDGHSVPSEEVDYEHTMVVWPARPQWWPPRRRYCSHLPRAAAVPVLNAVRDAATGLDKITVPAVVGARGRTILVNPAPTPAADVGGLQDFIYWRPDATGTVVEPVYVMLKDPLYSGRFTRKHLDKKYKHAIDFGISDTKKNSETLTKFRDAIEAHLADKETVDKGIYPN